MSNSIWKTRKGKALMDLVAIRNKLKEVYRKEYHNEEAEVRKT